ncbi:Uncharacterized protein OBRU01_11341 [Operophtera brumata]|uniref:Cuticle protein n=1 Tax=Operophtera brumata TaxID=104452 RepID=A0A0L7LCB2_OPEBR|nr:Uncharacterized protein OBRU01_11341 [Operophtera brumata]
MKLFVFALFVVAATAAAPLDDSNGPVELIVNGVPDGQPLDIGDIVDIKLKEHSAGEVSATNLLHPFTAVGIAEAAAAAVVETPIAVVLPEAPEPEVTFPESVVLPAPAQPEVTFPEAVVLPAPAQPEVTIPEAVVLPAPAQPEVTIPEAVVLPAPAQPEVVFPESVALPSPAQPEVVLPSPAVPEVEIAESVPASTAQFPTGEVYNDGNVQVTVNAPQEAGVMSTIQGWFNMVITYFNDDGVQTTQQII